MVLGLNHHDLEILGEIDWAEGAIAVVKSLRGTIGLKYETMILDKEFSVEKLQEIKRDFNKELVSTEKKIKEEGVPSLFIDLFDKVKKNDVKKICKNLKITERDLFLLIVNSEQIGFSHSSKHLSFIPDHHHYEKGDINKLADTQECPKIRKKMMSKISGAFNERKNISCHLFQNGIMWHCFYFSYEDSLNMPSVKQHWKFGTHIHYVSYIWNSDKDSFWLSLEKRKTSFPNFHISYDSSSNETLHTVYIYGRALVNITRKRKS